MLVFMKSSKNGGSGVVFDAVKTSHHKLRQCVCARVCFGALRSAEPLHCNAPFLCKTEEKKEKKREHNDRRVFSC